MLFILKQLAEWVGGEIVGDESTPVARLLPLSEAAAGDLTLVDGEKNAKKWAASPAAAAVVPANFPADARPLIRVANPFAAFQALLLRVRGERAFRREIHPAAVIHPAATVGANASVGPHAVVGEGTVIGDNATLHAGVVVGRFCNIGDDVTLYPNVVIYDDCTLGHRVTLHAGAVIGADGFGYRVVNGRHVKVPQIGTVVLEDDVEIGANTTVDRATLGTTRVGAGTKIDNLVMVSHNCRIGRHNLLISQSGLAGSCSTGEHVILAGQAGIADHIDLGDRVIIGAQAGIISDVPAGVRMLGTPGMPGREFMRAVVSLQKVGDLRKTVEELEKRMNAVEGRT